MPPTDYDLIERIRAGHITEFAALAERYAAGALTLAVRMLGNRDDAEEAVQDAFVRVHKGIGLFRHTSQFSTWFYRILYNVCLTKLSRRRDFGSISFDDLTPSETASPELHDHSQRPDVLFEQNELQDVVEKGIRTIPSIYQGIFTLFFTQEMSYEEIAEVTGLPLNTVKTRLFRARRIVRDYVKAYLSDAPQLATMKPDSTEETV